MKQQLLFAVVFLAACTSDKKTPEDSSARVVVAAPDSAYSVQRESSSRTPNPCERTGLWAECSLERRLKQSGFVVKRLDEKPSRAGFSITPVTYSLGKTRLEAFFYESEAALLKDLQSMDTLAVAPRGSAGAWPSTPMLLRSANLAAVVLGQDARQTERAMLAITAGPPQPGSPR